MLQLKKITKQYRMGDTDIHALKGIDLAFRDHEFVSILGPSGCGKTTTLNIIGGLDRYTSGDLIINGRSTKEFKDKDWDAYRNHSIGFVFQSYNLIPHQTVLANVELALTLSGVSKSERRKRAVEALEKVGLGNQLNKKPSQMSGGQTQRVAIARALVNDPDILLADEPTGALDTQTSVQIMEIIKEISKDKLIIMVTHNPELAELYSSRIVKLVDGEVVSDTNPFTDEEIAQSEAEKNVKKDTAKGKKSMSMLTALSLSFNNLLTKKGRTFMTAFAGSIGIIGIALILALSTGVQNYIDDVQKNTLSSYPISITAQESDMAAIMSVMAETSASVKDAPDHDNDAVYENSMLLSLFNNIFSHDISTNNLTAFKEYVDEQLADPESDLSKYASSVQYSYNVSMNNYVKDENGEYRSTNLGDAFTSLGSANASTGDNSKTSAVYSMMSANLSSYNLWGELMSGTNGELVSDAIKEQYELVYGEWPTKANEIVLVLNKNNEISDIAFYALGLISNDEINKIFAASMNGEDYKRSAQKVSYEDICKITFKMLLNTDYYTDSNSDGVWEYIGDDETQLDMRVKNGYDLKISGIIRTDADPGSALISDTFGYTKELTEYIINTVNGSEIVKAQESDDNANLNVISGLPFEITRENEITDSEKAAAIKEYFSSLTTAEKAELYKTMVSDPSDEYVEQMLDVYTSDYKTRSDIETLIASTYGIDLEQAQSYLSGYTDEELADLMKEQFTNVIKSQYASAAEDTIKSVSTAPSEEELAALITRVTSQLTDSQTKIGYVARSWNEDTGMDITTIMGYLAGVPQAELDGYVQSAAAADAAQMYSQYAASDEETVNAKLAAAFDSTYGSENDEAVLLGYYKKYMPSRVSDMTYDEVLEKLGVLSLSSPSAINIYADTFENKDSISQVISDYNDAASEDDRISYTDYIALLMSGITTIINAISFGLIAFVSISLVVSSIMIGIITYISVLERTKEIGILRAIGASKKDVKRVFNAETIIVGFTSGALGIIISLILCIPINLIVHAVSGVYEINAALAPAACLILVAISMLLTLIAGLIPASVAAKKDPVEALRTE